MAVVERWPFMEVLLYHTANIFVFRFYGPVNPLGSCRDGSNYLTTLFPEQA